MKKFFSNKSTNFLKGLRLYLLSSFLIIAYSCDEKSEDVVPNNDFLLVENASSDFSNMLSFSFDGLNNIDLENVDIETQVLLIEERMNYWGNLNNYDRQLVVNHKSMVKENLNQSNLMSIDKLLDDFNNNQIEIIQEILKISEVSTVQDFKLNIKSVEESISELPSQERLELTLMVEMIKGGCDAIYHSDIEFIENPNARQASADSFFCNLTTGGIGTIYGAWAGGIAAAAFGASAIASGGVTIVVSLVVGSALSTVVC